MQVTMHTKIGRGEENRNVSGGMVSVKMGGKRVSKVECECDKREDKSPGDNSRSVIVMSGNCGKGM